MVIKKYKEGQIRNGTQVLSQNKRKTILFLSDLHLRPSGLGNQKKQIIYETCHRYNFIDVGYIQGLKQNETYKVQNISKMVQQNTGVIDANVMVLPYDIYSADLTKKQSDLLKMIEQFKPDALFHFTDPHSWYWLYQIQHLIRNKIPIIYYNIWDNLPYPKYNEKYYSCSDLIMNISKQTHNIVNQVCSNYKRQQWQTKYVPHGINTAVFRPLGKNNSTFKRMKQATLTEQSQFVLLFVNKNIIRKQAALIMEAWKYFVNNFLTEQQKKKVMLILKTQVAYPAGMPLNIYLQQIITDESLNINFINRSLIQQQLVALYNCSDAVVTMSTAEGFGLSTAEALACGKPIISPVIGGLQDQMAFKDHDGKLYFNNEKVPSNCYKTYTEHGQWVIPLWMKAISTTGSFSTPYIYQMYCTVQDLVYAIKQMYQLGKEKRKEIGEKGRQWLISEQSRMTSSMMAQSMVQNIDQMFKNWIPKNHIKMFTGKPINKKGNTGTYDPIKKVWS